MQERKLHKASSYHVLFIHTINMYQEDPMKIEILDKTEFHHECSMKANMLTSHVFLPMIGTAQQLHFVPAKQVQQSMSNSLSMEPVIVFDGDEVANFVPCMSPISWQDWYNCAQ